MSHLQCMDLTMSNPITISVTIELEALNVCKIVHGLQFPCFLKFCDFQRFLSNPSINSEWRFESVHYLRQNFEKKIEIGPCSQFAVLYTISETLELEAPNVCNIVHGSHFRFQRGSVIFGPIFADPINICATLKKALSKSKLQSVHYTRQNIHFIFQSCMYSGWISPETLKMTSKWKCIEIYCNSRRRLGAHWEGFRGGKRHRFLGYEL